MRQFVSFNKRLQIPGKINRHRTNTNSPIILFLEAGSMHIRTKNRKQQSVVIELLKVGMVSFVFLAGAIWWLRQDRIDQHTVASSTDVHTPSIPQRPASMPRENQALPVAKKPTSGTPSTAAEETSADSVPSQVSARNETAKSPGNEPPAESVPPANQRAQEGAVNRSLADLLDADDAGGEGVKQDAIKRLGVPVPSESELVAASELVRQVYSQDLSDATTSQQKNDLAQQMVKVAAETDDQASRFILLRSARNIAIGTGDVNHAMQFTNSLVNNFDIDAIEERTNCLTRVSQFLTSPAQIVDFGAAVLPVVEEMIDRGLFVNATELLQLAHTAMQDSRNTDQKNVIAAKQEEVKRYLDKYELIQVSFQELETNPADPVAAGKVGQFYCFARGLWSRGLPLLAASNLEPLRDVAREELAKPSATPQMVALADRWWELADSNTDQSVADAMRERACMWYDQSLPGLAGLDRVRVEKRLENRSPASVPIAERKVSDKDDKDIVAVLLHKRGLTPEIPITLYRSGRISTPTSTTAWTRQTGWIVQHNMLVMIYANPTPAVGYGIDVGVLDSTGSRYTGVDQEGRTFSGQITKMSADWARLRDTGPLAGQPKSDLVARITIKTPKMRNYKEKRLLANGHSNELDSNNRWVILNGHIILATSGTKFWLSRLRVNPDGTLVGSDQDKAPLNGRVVESTPLFEKLLNAR